MELGPRHSSGDADSRGCHRHRTANVAHPHACHRIANLRGGLRGELILTFISDPDFRKGRAGHDGCGLYYMANAGGRLAGALLSGLTYQAGGLALMLGTAAGMVAASAITVGFLKRGDREKS